MYYKRQKLENESEKDVITKEIISVTSAIEKIRKEIRLCDEVVDNADRMKKQIKQREKKEQNKKLKKKERKYEL